MIWTGPGPDLGFLDVAGQRPGRDHENQDQVQVPRLGRPELVQASDLRRPGRPEPVQAFCPSKSGWSSSPYRGLDRMRVRFWTTNMMIKLKIMNSQA